MSNRITEQQIEKIVRLAKQLAKGKVSLLFDCEQTGDEGAKEAAWQLVQRGLEVRLGWSQGMHGGAFKDDNRRISHAKNGSTSCSPQWIIENRQKS